MVLGTLKKSGKYEDPNQKVKDIITDANKERQKVNKEIQKRKRHR